MTPTNSLHNCTAKPKGPLSELKTLILSEHNLFRAITTSSIALYCALLPDVQLANSFSATPNSATIITTIITHIVREYRMYVPCQMNCDHGMDAGSGALGVHETRALTQNNNMHVFMYVVTRTRRLSGAHRDFQVIPLENSEIRPRFRLNKCRPSPQRHSVWSPDAYVMGPLLK